MIFAGGGGVSYDAGRWGGGAVMILAGEGGWVQS